MAKNIILCSDGTGKAGGAILNTNVFQLYKAVDTQNTAQLAFYDDGIGSSGFKALRLVSGAFGFGFQRNIINLYTYLAEHYEPGDKVFLFGFSRGAATVRALAGMIETVGLLKRDIKNVTTGGRLDYIKFTIEIIKAMRLYKRASKRQKEIEEFKSKKTHGAIDIEMVGVWDTVDALGFPQDSSWLIIGLSMLVDKVTNVIFPHRYYDFQLNKNVKNAYQALAIDDERRTFHPKVWNEVDERCPENIEQVWFAGAHSSVGGGLDRTGLSMITLDWMMTKAEAHGLHFNESLRQDVKDGMNAGGELQDSRAGINSYYRYGPRHIRELCSDKNGDSILRGNIKIHESVFRRIYLEYYAPIFPNKFEIVDTDGLHEPIVYEVIVDDVKKLKKRINLLHSARSVLYHVITEMTVLTAFLVWYFSADEFYNPVNSRVYTTLMSFVPGPFENFVYFALYDHTWFGIMLLLGFTLSFGLRKLLRFLTARTRKKINWWLFHDFRSN